MEESVIPPPFRIGLAMAGAVSAGAYTAGVLDFLVEALDAWHDAKARGENVPRHAVSLDVAAGASAGAMCAALLTILLPYEFPHARIAPDGSASGDAQRNPLYRAWVEAIGIEPMLLTDDLDRGVLESLLNCRVIDDILAESLRYSAAPKPRPWLSQPFAVRFTLGNLRGVPYAIDFRGSGVEAMVDHADVRGFRIGGTPPDPASDLPTYANTLYGHPHLPARSLDDPAGWKLLGDAAVASGAFPLFLKPRLISRSGGDYGLRYFTRSGVAPDTAPEPIPPAWKDRTKPPEAYAFACVDGGVFNNDPFELAREVVAGGRGKFLTQKADEANAAILMIAPFLGVASDGAAPELTADGALNLPPHAQIGPLLQSWIAQSRFKPNELALAFDETVYSRFVIAPSGSKAPEKSRYWIASGALEGFFGFFHKEFRKHDYQLGRRNCQRFLGQHFSLPQSNQLVAYGYAALTAAERDGYRVKTDGEKDGELPIIPLVGRLRTEEEQAIAWPGGHLNTDALMPAILARLDKVFALYCRQFISGERSWLMRKGKRAALSLLWHIAIRGRLAESLRNTLEKSREQEGL